jgi:hypothetical protein
MRNRDILRAHELAGIEYKYYTYELISNIIKEQATVIMKTIYESNTKLIKSKSRDQTILENIDVFLAKISKK